MCDTCVILEIKLRNIADQLDKWAEESKSGGWSTHQVQPMLKESDAIHVLLSRLRRRP